MRVASAENPLGCDEAWVPFWSHKIGSIYIYIYICIDIIIYIYMYRYIIIYIYKFIDFIEIRLRYQWISNHLLGGDHPFGESALFHVPHNGFAKSMNIYLFVQI